LFAAARRIRVDSSLTLSNPNIRGTHDIRARSTLIAFEPMICSAAFLEALSVSKENVYLILAQLEGCYNVLE